VIGINGAAARLVHPGDVVILIGYGQYDDAEARTMTPSAVFVDARNAVVHRGASATHVPDPPDAGSIAASTRALTTYQPR
jgi:aspartate 1-decarboxylase